MNLSNANSFAMLSGILAGVCGFLYSVAFVVLKNTTLYSLFLVVGGLFTSAVLVAAYERVRPLDAAWTTRGLIMGVTGAAGAIIHGGYDLANAVNPPASDPVAAANLPSQIDPRGLLTFFMMGLGVIVLAWLMGRSGAFPAGLVYLGYALAAVLMLVYLGRLIIVDANSPLILAPAALTGFLVNPIWLIWLGLALGSSGAPAATPRAGS